ncbi:transcription termination/antitermination factor NusG [Candidatus Shapirobacteria bacterium]|nr:MAG: transcription termination/antitermination factor NusG [Candidatus Shapirobacteria bacterium]
MNKLIKKAKKKKLKSKKSEQQFIFQLSSALPSIDAQWYAVNTYSGHEYKAIEALKTRIRTMNLEDQIFQAIVPIQSKMVIRRGQKVKIKEKTLPGYILIQMVMNDNSWTTVKTTPGITNFIAIDNKPSTIPQKEIDQIVKTVEEDKPKYQTPFTVGEVVKITNGPFTDFIGTIESVDTKKGKIKVLVSFFERETPVELDFLQVSKEL